MAVSRTTIHTWELHRRADYQGHPCSLLELGRLAFDGVYPAGGYVLDLSDTMSRIEYMGGQWEADGGMVLMSLSCSGASAVIVLRRIAVLDAHPSIVLGVAEIPAGATLPADLAYRYLAIGSRRT